MEEVAQTGCRLSVPGDSQNTTGRGPGQPALTCLRRAVGLRNLQSSLPTSTDSVNFMEEYKSE